MSSYRINRKKLGRAIGIIAVILLLAAGAAALAIGGLNAPLDKDSDEIKALTIESGATPASIGRLLEENEIIENADDFKLYARLHGYSGRLKAGEYNLSPSMEMKEIMEIICAGMSNTVRFTIPEGYTLKQTAEKLASENLINTDSFMSEVKNGTFDYKFMKYLPAGENRLEGYLFPETYDVYTTADEHDIIDKMLSQFDKVFKDEYYARAEELGYSVSDIITIASLIERETRVDSERAKVASVIYNRLDAGMRLQIDATVQYALGEQKERLLYKDLEIDSPYNTYQNDGLPPGPICSPGEASIIAALYPEDTDYYYYVLKSKNDITHNFATSGKEFREYEAAYKATL